MDPDASSNRQPEFGGKPVALLPNADNNESVIDRVVKTHGAKSAGIRSTRL